MSSSQNSHPSPTTSSSSRPAAMRSSSVAKQKRRRSTGGSSGTSGSGSFSSLLQHTMHPTSYLRGRIVKKAAAVVDKYVTDLSRNASFLKEDAGRSSNNNDNSTRQITKTTRHGTEVVELPPPESTTAIPLLDRDELRIGKLLGEGGFCQVWEVTGVVLQRAGTAASSGAGGGAGGGGDEDDAQQQAQVRQALAKVPPQKLAMKQLRKRLVKHPPQFTLAAADLVVEAQYLSRLSHPHIIAIRGMTRGSIHPMTLNGRYDAYFLILDRLDTTLEKRIGAWQRGKEVCGYQEKLQYALQIASALAYLHKRRIIFRDLKPENIGFIRAPAAAAAADSSDSKNNDSSPKQQLQLFDFGLVRELPRPRNHHSQRSKTSNEEIEEEEKLEAEYEQGEDDDHGDHDDLDSKEEEENVEEEEDYEDFYQMTRVGTRRYAAVEIHISGRYNEKVDVYSWAMTVYEMISLQKPFASLTDADHQEYVCAQGRRPNMKPFLQQCEQPLDGHQPPILVLMREAWEQYVRRRIDIHTVVERMQEIVGAVDKEEKELANSVVSATTVTAAESDHDDEAISNDRETAANTQKHRGDAITEPRNSKDDSSGSKKKVEKNDSFELQREEDAPSIQSLIVDIDGASRHSMISAPSLTTVSGSEHTASLRWDDSINTASVGELASDASLSTVVFEEYLRPRQQRMGNAVSVNGDASASPLSATDTVSLGTNNTPPTCLAPPLTSSTKAQASSLLIYPSDSIVPPKTTLCRITSVDLEEDVEALDVSLLPDAGN